MQCAAGVRVLPLQTGDDFLRPRLAFEGSRGCFRLHGDAAESSSVRSRLVSRSSSPGLATEYSPAAVPPVSIGPNAAVPSSRAAATSISPPDASSASAWPCNPTALNPGRSGPRPQMPSTAIYPGTAFTLTNIPSDGY